MTKEQLAKEIYDELTKDGEEVTMEDCLESAEIELKIKGQNRVTKTRTASDKPKTVKVSEEKAEIFGNLLDFLKENYNFKVITPNKLVEIELNGKKFKLNLSENRTKKA